MRDTGQVKAKSQRSALERMIGQALRHASERPKTVWKMNLEPIYPPAINEEYTSYGHCCCHFLFGHHTFLAARWSECGPAGEPRVQVESKRNTRNRARSMHTQNWSSSTWVSRLRGLSRHSIEPFIQANSLTTSENCGPTSNSFHNILPSLDNMEWKWALYGKRSMWVLGEFISNRREFFRKVMMLKDFLSPAWYAMNGDQAA